MDGVLGSRASTARGGVETYEEGECLLELGDLLLSKRIGLEGRVSDARWGRGRGAAVVYGRAGYVLAESEEARGYRPWLVGG